MCVLFVGFCLMGGAAYIRVGLCCDFRGVAVGVCRTSAAAAATLATIDALPTETIGPIRSDLLTGQAVRMIIFFTLATDPQL